MSIVYAAGFQVTGASPSNMTLSTLGTGVTIASGYYLPGDLDTTDVYPRPGEAYEGRAYSAFADQVKTQFDAATASTFTVTWSHTTGLYTISRATNFSLTFSTAADLRLRAALGFTGNKTGTNTYTSDAVPAYVLLSTIDGRSNVQGQGEPDDIADEIISDGGDAYVVTRKTSELRMTWQQTMEPRTKIMEWAAYDAASGSIPWSYQTWFRTTRGSHPFWCSESLLGETQGALYQLTATGAAFRPMRVTADYDDQWIVPFEARWLGRFGA